MKKILTALLLVVGLSLSARASGWFGGTTTGSDSTITGDWTFTGHLQTSTMTVLNNSSATFNGPVEIGSDGSDLFTVNVATVVVPDTEQVVFSTDTTASGTDIFVIDGVNQRVGIGTDAPTDLLHVGDTTAGNFMSIDGGTAQNIGIYFRDAGVTGSSIIQNNSLSTFHVYLANDMTINESGTGADFRVESDNASRMFLVDGANDRVGIGDDLTPDATLDILSRASPSGYALAVSSQNDVDGGMFCVRGDGKVGVSTGVPQALFDVQGGSIALTGMSNSYIAISTIAAAPTADVSYAHIYSTGTASAELMTIDGGGNITQLSPHNQKTGVWRFWSCNQNTGRCYEVPNMEKVIAIVERLSGTVLHREWNYKER